MACRARVFRVWLLLAGFHSHRSTFPNLSFLCCQSKLSILVHDSREASNIMGFGDLKTDSGIKSLNEFLGDRSYIEGFVPSQADAVVFEELAKAPGSSFFHALRWYNHIKSYPTGEQQKFPGTKKAVSEYGERGNEQAPAKDDDDFDLFGDDEDEEEETEEEKKIKEERLAAYSAKKSGKKAVIAKSSIVLDVKPWDSETDPKEMEKFVRTIEMDGLLWGASKIVEIAYGVKKLQIMFVIEDDKVSVDLLQEQIEANQDLIQSTDVVAFNKI